MNFKIFIIISLLSALIFSCDNNRIIDESVAVNENGWKISDTKKITLHIKDITSLNNFYVNLRNTTDYRYNNIYLFIITEFPDKKLSKDTVECMLANREGKWIGKGWGKIKDNRFLIKQGVRFPLTGTYTFYIQHAMRDNKLAGIKNVGLRIEQQ